MSANFFIKKIIFFTLLLPLSIFCSSDQQSPTPPLSDIHSTPPPLEDIIIEQTENNPLLNNTNSSLEKRYASLEQELTRAKKTKSADNKKLCLAIITTILATGFSILQHYKLCGSN